ncbi:MAG: START-like domain-containing protein [Phycisphaerales bacterium]|nr:START-like domain-containing protein [Phycisphaerales bacterium]
MNIKKEKFTLQYKVKSAPNILFEFLSTPSGLQEWFADTVNLKGDVYVFTWDQQEEYAKLIAKEQNRFVRFQRVANYKNVKPSTTEPPEDYFEFNIQQTEISNQTVLEITDFAPSKDINTQKNLWGFQVKELLHRIGS